MDEFKFKIKGMDRVMTYDQLVEAGRHTKPRCVKIINVRQLTTWVTDYKTVKEKFG
jgi:hypothetical protein